ncbi:MAG: homocysteine S-methyltransferase family protein [Eubacteriales bacterium]
MRELIGKRILLSDGAMGTMLQMNGLSTGELPEKLNFTHPEIIEKIHSEYLDAGCDFICTNTFGASDYKLEGSGYSSSEVVIKAVAIAKKAVFEFEKNTGKRAFVGLDIGPIGKLMAPISDMTLEEAYGIFKTQIVAGEEAGADFVIFETFTDIYEMKAGILAAKENSKLPVICSTSFQEDGRMLMGTDPITMVNIISDMGIDALGVNCSLGPAEMTGTVLELLKYSKIPVIVQPNAGLPCLVDGDTYFNISPKEFNVHMKKFLELGVGIIGGCCGTTPEFIRELRKTIDEYMATSQFKNKSGKELIKPIKYTGASSSTKTVIIGDRVRIIGERINPTGKKALKEALRNGNIDFVVNEAINQVKAGAAILDINVGLPEIDEIDMMQRVIKVVSSVVDAPLQIDSSDPKVIEAAARIYNGKAIINSVNGKTSVMEAIFPIAKKYGACVIALTLDENGIPSSTEERLNIAERIINKAKEYGIEKERIIVDCLTLTVSAEQKGALQTLSAIRQVKEKFGVKTTLGASNISFGLPERKLLNRTFLTMALAEGLDAPITDPLDNDNMESIRSYEVLSGKDEDSGDYIRAYGNKGSDKLEKPELKGTNEKKTYKDELAESILEGFESKASGVTEELLKEMEALRIVEEVIIPALEIVGRNYETGEIFLPQLIKSADTVKASFVVLKKHMQKQGQVLSYGKVVVATVQGDIHDIGKNIAKVILENYGYEVIDLGKDVSIEKVVQAARDTSAGLIGLSALMTTTVVNMEATIKAIRAAGLNCKILVGGAVLTPEYAEKIGADYYAKDAMATVKAANQVYLRG